MIYLVCYDWLSTHGNHAGMSHLCDMLVSYYPKEMRCIKDYQLHPIRYFQHKCINKKMNHYREQIQKWKFNLQFHKVLGQLNTGDVVLLMEYVHPLIDQAQLAKQIKEQNSNVKVIGLAHLTPSALKEQNIGPKSICYWTEYVDFIMTLGHSLSDWLVTLGVDKRTIITAFHYVDIEYYHRVTPINTACLRVICMGNLQRNFATLEEIVRRCPDMNFTICSGKLKLSQFGKYKNVRLLGYMSEEQLRSEMEKANVSLNVMDDTVGSNVITTSMAMGLAMVVSDVGSIRDYCDSTNAFFCRDIDDYVQALHSIDVQRMSEVSIEKALSLSVTRFAKKLYLD